MSFVVQSGVSVEKVDTGYLVLLPGDDRVLHLTGEQAEAFDAARSGVAQLSDRLVPAMAGLVELGVVSTDSWTRRRVLQLGGAAAAAGMAVIALPTIAAADSPPGSSTPGTSGTSTTTTTTEPEAPATLYIADTGNNRVVSAPIIGGSLTQLVTTGLFGPSGVAVAGNTLYIANTFYSTVVSASITGGSPTSLVTVLSGPSGVAVA